MTAITALTDLVCLVSSDGNVVADPTLVGTCTSSLAAEASCVVGFSFTSTSKGMTASDRVVCTAGGISKTTVIIATVVTPAQLVIYPPSVSVSAPLGAKKGAKGLAQQDGQGACGIGRQVLTPWACISAKTRRQ